MITGSLQQKNGYYYAVLYLKVDGKRKCKWIPTKLPVNGTSNRKAQKAFDEIRIEYEREQKEIQRKEAELAELTKNTHPDALLPFTDYIEKWLNSARPSLATTTYQSYSNMIKARILPYFQPLGLELREVTPQHIEDFYQTILDDNCTTNTVIHYHSILRKAMQVAVKKDIILKNPVDKVQRPKKNVFHGNFYTEEEMMTLFDAVSGDPLELCVKIAAYYGLRRSEVLGLRWDAIDLERKTISINHKVIEAEVDGKFIPVGEDVLKTKSSFRTLPLIPAVEKLLLEEKEKQEMFRRLFKKSYCRDYLDYICVDQTGNLLRPNYVTEHFAWLVQKYDLKKIRFHDLRHTCASLLLSNGISMKRIQIWLGHSTFATTADIYAHLDFTAQEESANAMSGMFIRATAEQSA
ncbi:tyrosine-type recombinase/integrase [Allofournierella massiliensis]|uniref:tyrosine-type recombinase/integrase n=1 Tax=Allofournierella massiliensis TaxID=1650663 RepID=UPI0039A0434E